MWYYGKKRDTFAYALDMLLAERNFERIPFLDCISGRAFCMKCQKDIKCWFETAILVPQAAENINSLVFMGEDIIKCTENTVLKTEMYHVLLQNGCVIGPIRQKESIVHLQNRFYQGNQLYFFVKYDQNGYLGITDPLGTPIYYADVKDEAEVFEWGDYAIWISSRKVVDRNVEIDWNAVLEKGFELHEIYSREPHSIEKYNFSEYYQSCSSAHTSLYMALNHYLRQMAEIGNLLDTLYRDSLFQRKLRDLFSDVSEIKHTENLESLRKINDHIWELFYEEFRVFKADGFGYRSFYV